MNILKELLSNRMLICAVSAWFIAQVVKTIIHLIYTKQFVAERLIGGGGMPSCHSATVCSLCVAALYQYGVGSAAFAVSVIMATIVMYDAMGVRRETGNQAVVINEMMKIFTDMNSNMEPRDKLKEFIGHTPLQVIIGAALGVLISIAMNLLIW